MKPGIDFEAEGLLDGLSGKAREARLGLLEDLAKDGVPLEELKRAVEEDRLVLLPVERVFEEGTERYTAQEIAASAGLEHDFLVRLMRALGAPIPAGEERVYGEADLEAAKRAKLFLDAGLPEDGVLDTSRIIGISMANLADANRDLVGEVFTEPGVDERELAQRYAAAAQTMSPLLGETLLHAYRIHLREAIRQAVISEAELAEGRLSGSDEVTIAFADLVGFTRLGESLEIEQIGELTGRLFTLASEAARPPVRLVKMIGDAAMFSSRETVPLLDSVVGLVDAAGNAGAPLPACRRRSRPSAEPRGRLVRAPRQPRRPDHRLCTTGQRRRRAGREGCDRVRGRGRVQVLVRGQASLQGDRGRGARAPRPASRGTLSAALIRA